MTFEVESIQLDIDKHLNEIEGENLGMYAASTWHRLYEPFVPYDEGILAHDVTLDPWQITHNQVYAHYQYEGTNFNFKKQPHPQASAKWDQAARPTQESKFIADLQKYIDSGRLFK